MEQGLLTVLALFALYYLATREREPFGLNPSQRTTIIDLARGATDQQSVGRAASTACGMVSDNGAKASCMRLASSCSPVVGEIVAQARRLDSIRASTGMPPSPQQISMALRSIASQAPLCGAQMKTEGTTYADDFATLMKILTSNPNFSLGSGEYVDVPGAGPGHIDPRQLKPYLTRLGLTADSIAAIMKMVSNAAYLIPA